MCRSVVNSSKKIIYLAYVLFTMSMKDFTCREQSSMITFETFSSKFPVAT